MEKMEKRRLVLSCDFDGTICQHMFPAIGEPLPGAFETLKRFQEKGDRLILWTCREGMFLNEAIKFCKSNGIIFESHNSNVVEHDYAKSRKVYSDCYIDDRMVGGFPGWDVVEKYIDQLREEIIGMPEPVPVLEEELQNKDSKYDALEFDEEDDDLIEEQKRIREAEIQTQELREFTRKLEQKEHDTDMANRYGFNSYENLILYTDTCIRNKDWMNHYGGIFGILENKNDVKRFLSNQKKFISEVEKFVCTCSPKCEFPTVSFVGSLSLARVPLSNRK